LVAGGRRRGQQRGEHRGKLATGVMLRGLRVSLGSGKLHPGTEGHPGERPYRGVHQWFGKQSSEFGQHSACLKGATENARPDIARRDSPAPYRRGGHRETCFIVRVEAQYKLIFAAGSII